MLSTRNSSGERIDLTYHAEKPGATLVIFGHGVTGDKDRPLIVALAEGLSARGWPSLRISFSGNGESEGRFEDSTITKEVADLQSVLETVPDFVRVAYVGHSMGSAVGVMTAAKDVRIHLLVSLAGMAYTKDFVEREFGDVTPGAGFMWDDEDCPLSEAFVKDLTSIGNILPLAEKVSQPWLFVHGTADDVVPVKDGRDAHAAAVCRKQWREIEGAEHMFSPSQYPEIIDAVDDWLTACFGKA